MKMKTEMIIDRLGKIKAQIADLEEKEDELRTRLIASGIDSAEGKLFRATVSYSNFHIVDYGALVKALNPPKSMIAKFKREEVRVMVRIVSR